MTSSAPQIEIDTLTNEVFCCIKNCVERLKAHGVSEHDAWLESCSYVAAIGASYAVIASRKETPVYPEDVILFDKIASNMKETARNQSHALANLLKPLMQNQPVDTESRAGVKTDGN